MKSIGKRTILVFLALCGLLLALRGCERPVDLSNLGNEAAAVDRLANG